VGRHCVEAVVEASPFARVAKVHKPGCIEDDLLNEPPK
jgi:hypothetical protein